MKFITIFIVMAVCFLSARAQNYPMTETDPNQPTIASTVSRLLVEAFSRGARHFIELYDIKIRSIRFLASLYTTDNLVLLKKVMNVGLRFGNWAYSVIPESAEVPLPFFSFLFPQVNLRNEEEDETKYGGPQLSDFQSDSGPEKESTVGNDVSDEDFGHMYDRRDKNEVMNLYRLINSRSS